MSIKILVVEDTDDIRDALVISLTEAGFRVAAAARGEEAFEELSRFAPDIVLLDFHLPGMSGTDILKKMRETLTVPILMFTSTGAVDTVREAIALGATDYVLKDTGMDELVARVRKHLKSSDVDEGAESHEIAPDTAESAPHVLYVGEDKELMRMITDTAKRLSVDSTRVSTAKAALGRVRTGDVAVVVTELALRGSDGLSLLKSLKSVAGESAQVPVVMATDSAPPEIRRSAMSHGANAFFLKPVSAIEFEQLMKKLLQVDRKIGAA